MANERVDKSWQTKGLKEFPTPAILQTLNHYGVAVDEPKLQALVEENFPLRIATTWMHGWKGTGQFSQFPLAAALELYRRVRPDELSANTYARGLAAHLEALAAKIAKQGSEEHVAYTRTELDALTARVPKDGAEVDADFVEEIFAQLEQPVMQAFEEIAPNLAKAGYEDDARKFVTLEETLVPDARGTASALVDAAVGKKDEAVQKLTARAADASASLQARLMAVDILIELEAEQPAREHGEAVLEAAEKAEEHHVAMAVVQRLEHLYEISKDEAAMQKLAERAEKIHAAHDEAHPHHH